MNRRSIFIALVGTLAVALFAGLPLVDGKNWNGTASADPLPTVTICHKTDSPTNPWVQITVSYNSVPDHLAHGDFLVDPRHPCPPPPCPVNDVIVDADGTASAGDGIPGAVQVKCGDILIAFPMFTPIGNGCGLDLIDRDGSGTNWTPGDDLMVEGTAFCPTAIRDAIYQAGFDCKVLDVNGDLVGGEFVTCDVEIGGCRLSFHDANGNGYWDDGEDIIRDGNGNGVFD